MKQIQYTGSSKLISRIVHLLNRKAPLPLDGQGDAVWGTNGQVLTTDGNGNTSWTTPQGGGGDVTDVEVNGTSVVNAQGVAEVTVPTNTSDLNNDSGFITNLVNDLANYYTKSQTYTQAEVNQLISGIVTLNILVVQALPTQDISTTTIYLVPKQDTGTSDIYDEYLYINNAWELIGTTQIDLSNYVTTTDLSTALADYVTSVGLATILADYVQSSDLATVATSGAYADLSGLPTIVNAHVIENPEGTDMTQRANMQFADAHLADDSVNDRTKVEVIKHVDAQGWNDATEDGAYDVDDGGNFVPITGAEIAYDANTSINQKIDELADSVDYLKDAQLQRSVTIATSAVGVKYYAVLGHLPIVYPAMPTIDKVNVLGVGDAPLTDFTVGALDANGNYYMSTTNSSYGGKALWVEMSI